MSQGAVAIKTALPRFCSEDDYSFVESPVVRRWITCDAALILLVWKPLLEGRWLTIKFDVAVVHGAAAAVMAKNQCSVLPGAAMGDSEPAVGMRFWRR